MSTYENCNPEKPAHQRQNEVRHRVLKGARIAFKDRAATIDCVIRNLSVRGACLIVETPVGIPDMILSFCLITRPSAIAAWPGGKPRRSELSSPRTRPTANSSCSRQSAKRLVRCLPNRGRAVIALPIPAEPPAAACRA